MKPPAHASGAPPLSELASCLRSRSRKMTGPREAIFKILRHHPHPLTNREIFFALPKGTTDLATIYRVMHLLESLKLVKRCDFGDGKARFELVGAGREAHHHHLVCTECAEIVEVPECFPSSLEKKIASQNGFKAITHKLEFFGVCPACQSPAG